MFAADQGAIQYLAHGKHPLSDPSGHLSPNSRWGRGKRKSVTIAVGLYNCQTGMSVRELVNMKNKIQSQNDFDPPYYDDEEREIIEAFKRGEYVSIRPLAESKKFWQEAARNHNAKKNNSSQ